MVAPAVVDRLGNITDHAIAEPFLRHGGRIVVDHGEWMSPLRERGPSVKPIISPGYSRHGNPNSICPWDACCRIQTGR